VLSYAVLAVHISGTPQKKKSGRFFAEAGLVRSPWRFWLGRRGVATNVSKEFQPPAWQEPRGKRATRQTWLNIAHAVDLNCPKDFDVVGRGVYIPTPACCVF
jgi:hypothetical protein